MHMERAIPILPTNDLAAAKAFYVDGLGFRVTFEASADGRTGLLGLQRGSIELTLDCPMDGHGRNACVSLHVADADAYYREWSAKVTPLRLATRCSSLALSVDRLLTCAERREQASDGE
jgi:catechol 2,3-dioxygenase-like lactoylglutathione lyase family enzyme